jgi:hypothetical protein
MNKGLNIKVYIIAFLMSAFGVSVNAQTPTDSFPKDPGGISVYTIQNLSFGAFSRGNNGGTISISTSGARTATGDLILLSLGFQYYYAIFDVESPPNNIISILNGPPAILNGSNGGTITLNIGSSYPTSPFINYATPPNRTQVNVGGTIVVGSLASAPPGNYSGVFYLTFNQE